MQLSAEYVVVRSDNFGWTGDNWSLWMGRLYSWFILVRPDWATWFAGMNGAKVVVYVANNNNGNADVLAITTGTKGKVDISVLLWY